MTPEQVDKLVNEAERGITAIRKLRELGITVRIFDGQGQLSYHVSVPYSIMLKLAGSTP